MVFPVWIIAAVLLLSAEQGYSEEVVLTAINYPPFYGETLDGDGPFTEVIVDSFKAVGYSVRIVYQPWKRAMATAREGTQAHGMVGVWHTQEREKAFLFSDPILPNKMAFFKRRDTNIVFTSYSNLAARGYKLGLVRGYAAPKGLLESNIPIEFVTQDIQNIQKLAAGRIDLVVLDKNYANYVLQDHPKMAAAIEGMTPILETIQQHLVISRNIENAQTIMFDFNRGLKRLRNNGEFQKYSDKLTLIRPFAAH